MTDVRIKVISILCLFKIFKSLLKLLVTNKNWSFTYRYSKYKKCIFNKDLCNNVIKFYTKKYRYSNEIWCELQIMETERQKSHFLHCQAFWKFQFL